MVSNRRKFGVGAARHRAHAPHAPAREPVRAGRGRRTAPSSPRTCSRLRRSARRGEHRGVLRRADRGLDRLPRAAQGLSRPPAGDLRPARHPAGLRRGDHRLRPHRAGLRRAELRRDARHDDDGQGASPTARSRWARSRSRGSTTRSSTQRPRARSSCSTATPTPATRPPAPRAWRRSTSTATKACSSAACGAVALLPGGIFSLRDLPVVEGHARLRDDGRDRPRAGRRARQARPCFQKKLFDNGLHLKATGDAAIVAPPLIARRQHVDMIVEILRRTLQTL